MRAGVWVAGALLLGGQAAQAAGFEKALGWSGRYAGMGGATAAPVEGPQSLAFNPAGLAAREGAWADGGTDGPRFEASLNFSPTFSGFSGPVAAPGARDSDLGFSPVFGAVLGGHFGRVGVGAGAFYVGGTNAKYSGVDYSGLNPLFESLKPDIESYLALVDVSAGAGVELAEGLRVGAAWRVSLLQGRLSSAAPIPAPAGAPPGTPPVALVALRLDDLTDAQFTGFRVGAQYAPRGGKFGLGVNWRTPVTYTATGTLKGTIASGVSPGAPADVDGGEAKAAARLPGQLAAGGYVAPIKELRVVGEYVYTRYSDVDRIAITGTLPTPSGPLPVPGIALDFDDQHQIRGAVEYLGIEKVALRAGYVWTSRVTATDRARATLSAPGPGHSVTAGVGTRLLGDRLGLDLAGEFSRSAGEGTNELRIPGDFEAWAAVVHLGATVAF